MWTAPWDFAGGPFAGPDGLAPLALTLGTTASLGSGVSIREASLMVAGLIRVETQL